MCLLPSRVPVVTRPAHSDEGIDFARLYAYRFRNVDQAARQRVWGEIAPYLWERMGRPERVLDPAAGRGEFIRAVPAAHRTMVDAVDYPEVEDLRGVERIVGDALTCPLPAAAYDGVLVSNLLEHLDNQHDIARFLRRMRDALVPGGRIAVLGPNFRYCAGQYFDMADHTLALTHVAVQEHLAAAGFDEVSAHPRFLPYSFTGLLPPSPALTRLYLRTPLAWRLLGKQFLVVAAKPADA